MSIFPEELVGAIFISRTDPDEPFGSDSAHPIELEGKTWPTVEHYFQAMQFESEALQQKILQLTSAHQCRRFSKWRFWQRRKDWQQRRQVLMTRAVYTKCKMYPHIAKLLLDTEQATLVESSNYDYFWGCGRDRRGDNTYGKVLMNVRAKLLAEQS